MAKRNGLNFRAWRRGAQRIGRFSARRRQKARNAAGFVSTKGDPERGLRFHDLRHHFATELRRRGVGLDVVSKLLGHSAIAVTGRYAHVLDDVKHEAVADLDGLGP